ncbi:MAG: hypothetical protein L0Z50_25645 [Verrucomicrobiales bacterium]|nr:hypothetical protein [Verrucomicrobiales bacterium]
MARADSALVVVVLLEDYVVAALAHSVGAVADLAEVAADSAVPVVADYGGRARADSAGVVVGGCLDAALTRQRRETRRKRHSSEVHRVAPALTRRRKNDLSPLTVRRDVSSGAMNRLSHL